MRRGVLYRSGDLSRIAVEDGEVLRRLGLSTIVDLRSAWERGERANRWPDADAAIDVWHHDLTTRPGSDPLRLRDLLAANPGLRGAHDMMLESYRQMAVQSGPTIAALFERLANDPRPVLIHCTGGKDRTGVVCALIQSAVGVPRSTIEREYLRSLAFIDREGMRAPIRALMLEKMKLDLDIEAIDAINSVHVDYLAAAFDELRSRHGAMHEYLAAHDVSQETLARALRRLREN